MKAQRVKLKYPHIKIEIGDKTYALKDWEGKVKDLQDLRRQITSGPDQLFTAALRVLKETKPEVKVSLEEFQGQELSTPLVVRGFRWVWTSAVSAQSLEALAGKDAPIRYMSRLHKTLYGVSIKDRKAPRRIKTMNTLRTLGLVESPYKVTEKGKLVLKQLQELGPPGGMAGLYMIGHELLDINLSRRREKNPLRDYLMRKKLIMRDPIALYTGGALLAQTGRAWLEERSEELLRSKKFGQELQLIAFLPERALNQFLTSDDRRTRDLAKARMDELRLYRS